MSARAGCIWHGLIFADKVRCECVCFYINTFQYTLSLTYPNDMFI